MTPQKKEGLTFAAVIMLWLFIFGYAIDHCNTSEPRPICEDCG